MPVSSLDAQAEDLPGYPTVPWVRMAEASNERARTALEYILAQIPNAASHIASAVGEER